MPPAPPRRRTGKQPARAPETASSHPGQETRGLSVAWGSPARTPGNHPEPFFRRSQPARPSGAETTLRQAAPASPILLERDLEDRRRTRVPPTAERQPSRAWRGRSVFPESTPRRLSRSPRTVTTIGEWVRYRLYEQCSTSRRSGLLSSKRTRGLGLPMRPPSAPWRGPSARLTHTEAPDAPFRPCAPIPTTTTGSARDERELNARGAAVPGSEATRIPAATIPAVRAPN